MNHRLAETVSKNLLGREDDYVIFKVLRDFTTETVASLMSWAETVDNADHYAYEMMVTRERLKAYKFEEFGREYVWVYTWGRDCDLFEASHIDKIQASETAYGSYEALVHDNAEGPTVVRMISPQEAAEFKATRRDRAAEMMNY